MHVRVKTMKIGELSKRTGVSVRMLRHYEELGLVRPQRTAAGYRTYGAGDIGTIKRVVLLNKAGLELRRLRHLIGCELGDNGMRTQLCAPLRSVLASKHAELARQISDLRKSYKMLSRLLAAQELSMPAPDRR
jgi:MerR family transcriptional regulator, copper efflux regulator